MKEYASVVVLNDNENGKMLKPHALGDTTSPSRQYGHIRYEVGE